MVLGMCFVMIGVLFCLFCKGEEGIRDIGVNGVQKCALTSGTKRKFVFFFKQKTAYEILA